MSLPALPLNNLVIKPANPAQTLVARQRTCRQWNFGLTLEQYLQRQSQLDDADNGNTTYWYGFMSVLYMKRH